MLLLLGVAPLTHVRHMLTLGILIILFVVMLVILFRKQNSEKRIKT
jgi:hypothetical protein